MRDDPRQPGVLKRPMTRGAVHGTAWPDQRSVPRSMTRSVTRPVVSAVGALRVVRMSGEVDLPAGIGLHRTLLLLAADQDVPAVVVDLQRVSFLDSAGLNVLAEGLRHLRCRGAVLALAGCPPPVRRLLQATGLDCTFPLYESTDAAVSYTHLTLPTKRI